MEGKINGEGKMQLWELAPPLNLFRKLFTWGRILRRQAAPCRLRENSKQVSE
jgi:hypothetical protein